MNEVGNHKIRPERLVEAIRKAQRSARKASGADAGTVDSAVSSYAPPPAWRGLATRGTVKIFALLIDFPDYPHVNGRDFIHERLFGAGVPADSPYESLASFYTRSSYGQLSLNGGSTLGWYRTGYNRSTVSQTRTGRENLIKEALAFFQNDGHDFSQYDNDGNGTIDYFLVIWSGPDNGWGGFWWGYQTSFGDGSFTVSGKRIGDYSWQWESNPVGSAFKARVAIHETGHALGLPDYYDYDEAIGPPGGVGGLDMMDSNWGDHNSFSKWVLDWIAPAVVGSGSRNIPLNPSATSGEAVLLMPGIEGDDPFGEFFMVQNRSRTGNDKTFPADGLIVWHVDAALNPSGSDFLYNNSYSAHKLLRLMEADGLEEIGRNQWADAGDFYSQGMSLTNSTTPSSAAYSGQPTRVEITGISREETIFSATYSIADLPPPPRKPSPPSKLRLISPVK